ncbi:DUF998 domain-containing protein [Amycolatopsis sp. PS_44_ISF1]|uniref:DUF998 domain-containing protein n=1 Tax=Amycolatopsis sp. PS_44_ISF1 TaxID=2974917 RepID=UPI0028DF2084|nr:DUF998 domain-containing protein [Amycolatopsis sp. PS_44_ISF1]MDT8913836.1 DUF998 domain-containing protein [Amycolatopsis sp. PS_44_ISF1]
MAVPDRNRNQDRRATGLAVAGIVALAVGALLVLLLGLVPPTNRISVTTRTISEYGLGPGKQVFDLAVVLVAAGSAAGLSGLRRQRRLPVAAAVLGALWTVGLLVVVAFPKTDWASATGSGGGGALHRAASVVAFACLPLAVLSAARVTFPRSPRRRLAARLLAGLSLGWFAVILGAVAVAAVADERWWQLIPLGLVERAMALTELVALAALVAPVRRAQNSSVRAS